MSDQITYDDKADLIVDTTIDDIFKVSASDMNEIKNVVNNNVEIVDEINNPENWVSVGTTAPTDGRRVWFEKGKNLFDGQLELGMYDTTTGVKATNNANYRNVAPINVQPSTTYTFSINGTSQKYVVYFYKKDGTFISANASLTSGTFTTPAETYLLNFRCFNADFTSDYANLKIQLEEGSTATTYEPYVEHSINVDEEEWYNPNNIDKYSTNETKIGTWIDGKPLYRKVISVASSQFYGQTGLINHNISNLNCVINQRFIWTRTDSANQYRQLPSIYYGNTEWSAQTYVTDTQVVFELGSTIANKLQNNSTNCYIILEYTKSTD